MKLIGRPTGSAFESREDLHRRNGTRIGAGTRVYGTIDRVNPHLVEIGDYCVVGTDAALLAHCPIRGPGRVKLGDYVWMGFGALVLPGVEIGSCTIIGAGSVVTKNVPTRSIVAGNPARVIRSLTDEEAEKLTRNLRATPTTAKDWVDTKRPRAED